jgi:hypothetical protein
MRCPECGQENPEGSGFCTKCGRSTQVLQGKGSYGGPYVSNIALDIILSIITCGIYWFFWQARQIRALNFLLREKRFSFPLWFFLSIVTCFLFNIYYEYIMAQAVVEVQRREGGPLSNELPVVSLILSIFGMHIVTDAIQQHEINKLFGK